MISLKRPVQALTVHLKKSFSILNIFNLLQIKECIRTTPGNSVACQTSNKCIFRSDRELGFHVHKRRQSSTTTTANEKHEVKMHNNETGIKLSSFCFSEIVYFLYYYNLNLLLEKFTLRRRGKEVRSDKTNVLFRTVKFMKY